MPRTTDLSIIALVSILLASASAPGRAAVCGDPDDAPLLAVKAAEHGTSALDANAGETTQQTRDLRLLLGARSGAVLVGFDHRYTQFNFERIQPQTNAHLHRSALPIHWFPRGREGARFALALELAASSNVLGHPQEYDSDTFNLAFAATGRRILSATLDAWYGFCGDRSFGQYRVYPTAGIRWKPHEDLQFDLGFPAMRIRYAVTPAVTTSLELMPDGNDWHVMDRSFAAESNFNYEAYALEWTLELFVGPQFSIAGSLGRQFSADFEMTLQNGDRAAVTGDAVSRVAAELRWRF